MWKKYYIPCLLEWSSILSVGNHKCFCDTHANLDDSRKIAFTRYMTVSNIFHTPCVQRYQLIFYREVKNDGITILFSVHHRARITYTRNVQNGGERNYCMVSDKMKKNTFVSHWVFYRFMRMCHMAAFPVLVMGTLEKPIYMCEAYER